MRTGNRRLRLIACACLLMMTGCGKAPENAPASHDLPTPVAAATPRHGMPPPAAAPPPATPAAAPRLSPQAVSERLQIALQNHAAEADEDERSNIAEDVAKLAESGDPQLPQVAQTLAVLFQRETSAVVKEEILTYLGEFNDPAVMSHLLPGLAPTQPREVRETAIAMLEYLQDPRALGPLQNLLTDADAEVREAAREALETLTGIPLK